MDGILCISDLNEIPSDILDRGVPIVCIDRRPVVDRVVPWVATMTGPLLLTPRSC